MQVKGNGEEKEISLPYANVAEMTTERREEENRSVR